jgi:hypothetical protein
MFIKILNKYNMHYYILVIYILLCLVDIFKSENRLQTVTDIFSLELVHFQLTKYVLFIFVFIKQKI